MRAEIKDDVLIEGYDGEREAFVQAYGSKHLDASTLMLPLVGFIRVDDPRMRSTIGLVERELMSPQGYMYRYQGYDDGLAEGEGPFVICTFWLVDNLIALGQVERARALFEKLRSCSSDVGLLSEQIDPQTGEMLGNFPQAFSHVALINAATQLRKATAREEGRPSLTKEHLR